MRRFKRSKIYINILVPFGKWALRKAEKAKANLKMLGWFWGSICFIISGAIFYSPAIYFVVMFFITGNGWYWTKAGAYVAWWFLPMFSPAMVTFLLIVLFVTTIAIKIKKIFIRRKQYENCR